MTKTSTAVSPLPEPQEAQFEASLRPASLSEYIGQEVIKFNLHTMLAASRARSECVEHVLFAGPAGLGKTTLANIVANEMGAHLKTTSGPAIEHQGTLVALLASLSEGDILFIDEIHRLPKAVEEVLYPAMEDFHLDIAIAGDGGSAQVLHLPIAHFTLIGATTRAGLLSAPLRDRCGQIFYLSPYPEDELRQIVERSARILSLPLTDGVSAEIAKRGRGVPRIGNRILRRIRDYAQVHAQGVATTSVALQALGRLGIDERGLDAVDRALILTIIHKFNGGPVSLKTIASAIDEDPLTVEEAHEPYLIQLGFLERTPRGRRVTYLAKQVFRNLAQN